MPSEMETLAPGGRGWRLHAVEPFARPARAGQPAVAIARRAGAR